MSLSFWKDNPCAPTWRAAAKLWWNCGTPSYCSVSCTPFQIPNTPTITIQILSGTVLNSEKLEQLEELLKFWRLYYKTSTRCRFVMPPAVLKGYIESGAWILLVVRESERGTVIGTLVSRRLGWARICGAVFEGARCIDFLCVAHAWRKRGVARRLLQEIHNHTVAAAPSPLPPHFFCLERGQWSIPPLTQHSLVVRLGGEGSFSTESTPLALQFKECTEPLELQEAYLGIWKDSSYPVVTVPAAGDSEASRSGAPRIFRCGEWFLAILQEWHISIPEGYPILTLLGPWRGGGEQKVGQSACGAVATLVESFIDTICKGCLVLTSISTPRVSIHWKPDATAVQWIVYNIQSGMPSLNAAPLLLHS